MKQEISERTYITTMSYLKRQYTRLQDYMLERKLGQTVVTRSPGNFNTAKKIGLLFNATNLEVRNTVLTFAEQLKNRNKKVDLLGFYNEKNTQPNFPFKHFTQKELNFLRQPAGTIVRDFMFEPFDILINLCLEDEPALAYITALSAAHLRVGPYTDKTYCYDLMIDTNNRQDVSQFIGQVTSLLNKVNKTPHESTTT